LSNVDKVFTPLKQKAELLEEGVLHPLTQAVRFWPAAKGAARRKARRVCVIAMAGDILEGSQVGWRGAGSSESWLFRRVLTAEFREQ
jgi:hypothetical protein